MRFLVVERFKGGDARPVYRRFRAGYVSAPLAAELTRAIERDVERRAAELVLAAAGLERGRRERGRRDDGERDERESGSELEAQRTATVLDGRAERVWTS